MLWCGASWVKRLQFWLNWGVGRLAAWEGLVFFPGKNTHLLNYHYFKPSYGDLRKHAYIEMMISAVKDIIINNYIYQGANLSLEMI